MRCRILLPALALLALATAPSRANSIYEFTNYASLQGGVNGGTYTIVGTIVTDGARALASDNILSWELTATNPVAGNPTLRLTSSDTSARAIVLRTSPEYTPIADNTGIYLPTGLQGQNVILLRSALGSYNFGSFTIPGTDPGIWATEGQTNSQLYWYGTSNLQGNIQYAAFESSNVVPEPSTIATAVLGLAGVGLVAHRRRRSSPTNSGPTVGA